MNAGGEGVVEAEANRRRNDGRGREKKSTRGRAKLVRSRALGRILPPRAPHLNCGKPSSSSLSRARYAYTT
jgi:hypothetical protein